MNIGDILGKTASVAVAVERSMEMLKPAYLALKNKIMKKEQTECSKLEKTVMTIFLSIFLCISLGIGIDIPGVAETAVVQQVLAGLVSSFGSSMLHTLLTILASVKDTIETRTAGIQKEIDKSQGRNGNQGKGNSLEE